MATGRGAKRRGAATKRKKEPERARRRGPKREEGPKRWFLPQIESAYARILPRDQAPQGPVPRPGREVFRSAADPEDKGGDVAFSSVDTEHWARWLSEYQRRKARARTPGLEVAPAPALPGKRNWRPLGPSVVTEGQAVGSPPVGGRIAGIAVARDGKTLYAASANGGVFLNRDPRGEGNFDSRNNGLACLCVNFFAQHPTDPAVLYCGLQDNGSARTAGGSVWKHIYWGDGGHCLVNWADPSQVLVFSNGEVVRATDGGDGHGSWVTSIDSHKAPWFAMAEPLAGTPYTPARPASAKQVAFGSAKLVGTGLTAAVYISQDFGKSWPEVVALPTNNPILALTFANASRLFAGTAGGEVFRLDRRKGGWKVTQIDGAEAGPLGFRARISDIGVDWSDSKRASIYVTLGGVGSRQHVWHFDGARWESRSGTAGNGTDSLLDVEHNAVVVDPRAPDHVYAGADIGVWYSPDRGKTWTPLSDGLPDAPVFDLQIHPTQRLLRVSTHGRGLYEFPLSP